MNLCPRCGDSPCRACHGSKTALDILVPFDATPSQQRNPLFIAAVAAGTLGYWALCAVVLVLLPFISTGLRMLEWAQHRVSG